MRIVAQHVVTKHVVAEHITKCHVLPCASMSPIHKKTSAHDNPGGFGGGPQQLPHLATTYAAVAALVTIGGPHALHTINRTALQAFLQSRCVPAEQGGGMTMHHGTYGGSSSDLG